MKAENQEELAHDDDQAPEETKEDIKHSDVMLEEVEQKTNEDFLSHMEDFELQEDLMIEREMRPSGLLV